MRRARTVLITLVIGALALRIIWWAIAPLLPILLIGLVIVLVVGTVWFRQKKW